MHTIRNVLLLALLSVVVSACGTAPQQETRIPTMAMTISPDAVKNGEINTPYTFTVTATGIRQSAAFANLHYSFAGGQSGKQEVAVSDGTATFTVSQSFSEAGAYGFVAAVEAGGRSATGAVFITIGNSAAERELEMASCDDWVSQKAGGHGVTVDRWDISAVPAGAVFDLRYETYTIPDRFLVSYPGTVLAHDTGWRGHSRYDGGELYPGGVVGAARGTAAGVVIKGANNELTLVVMGPDKSTEWNYELRCRVP